MQPFKYTRAGEPGTATKLLTENSGAKLLAGGTNLVDLMKEDVERPSLLIDIAGLKYSAVTALSGGGVSIGALGKNTDTANDALVRENYPLLSQAILAGASVQIRNMATNGGNLNQRTRCPYFYETAMPCNKRAPGTGCGALRGVNRLHAVFGWSEDCIAVHPSDMCVALAALDATVKVNGAAGERSIPFAAYHRLPGNDPSKDNTLQPGEVITSIALPANKFQRNSYYLKIRDRASYAFALISVAAALEMNGNTIVTARLAMGGVAHKPWRLTEAENFLAGKTPSEAVFGEAGTIAMRNAKPFEHNQFKVAMGSKAVTRALLQAAKGAS